MLLWPALAWAADSAEYRTLAAVAREDAALDQKVAAVADDLNRSKITAAQAKHRWADLLAQEQSREKKLPSRLSQAIREDFPNTPEKGGLYGALTAEVKKLLQLQTRRIQGLVHAAEVEIQQGTDAAKTAWDEELKARKAYMSQRDKVAQKLRMDNT